jgi:hypothetical protein
MNKFNVGDKVWWAHPDQPLSGTVKPLRQYYKRKELHAIVHEIEKISGGTTPIYTLIFPLAAEVGGGKEGRGIYINFSEEELEFWETPGTPVDRLKYNYIDV